MSTEVSPILESCDGKHHGYGSNNKSDLVSSAPENNNPANKASVDHFHVYKRRWWILVAFSLCFASQSAQWNAWSPIIDAVQISYGWTDSFVTMFPAASNAAFVLLGFPVMYLIEVRGLRVGTALSACLLVLTIAFWNIALGAHQNWLVVIGSMFNGVSGAITMSIPPLLSSVWFPVNERTTATAIAASSGYFGTGISFIAGPYISGANVTAANVANQSSISAGWSLRLHFKVYLRQGVQNVIYFNTALALLCLACVLLYYPDKPPKPPTKTAEVEREDFSHGIKDLCRNPYFIILAIAYNVPNGTYNSWLPLISLNFRPLGISEKDAGWIGFASIMAGCIGSIILSAFTDHFKRKMKLVVQIMNAISIICLVILVCVQERYIKVPQHSVEAVLYTLCIIIGIAINGSTPFYYELGCEMAYPVNEGLTCSFLTITNNFIGTTYFLLFQIPGLSTDTQWMTWTALATSLLSVPLLVIMKESFKRLDIDQTREDNSAVVTDSIASSM